MGSVVVVQGLSCSAEMWDLPGPGIEPVSPALAGGFLTTAPPGKPLHYYFLTALPLFLYSLNLISNCLNLPFGTQGRSRRLKPFSCKREMEGPESSFMLTVSVPAPPLPAQPKTTPVVLPPQISFACCRISCQQNCTV